MLAAIIALMPTILSDSAEALLLWRQYEPEVASLIKTYGPEVEDAILPLIKASIANGTLASDIEGIITKAKAAAPLMGTLTSLGDLASAIGSIQPVDIGNPTPDQDRLARPTKMGGR